MKVLTNFFLHHFIKDKRFYRFIFVGIINTIFGYAVYALLIYLHFHYVWAALLSTIVGTLFNFKTTGKIVFNNSRNHLLLKFIMVYALVYILNITIIRIVTSFYSNQYLGGALALLVAVPVAFILNKEFVFKGKL